VVLGSQEKGRYSNQLQHIELDGLLDEELVNEVGTQVQRVLGQLLVDLANTPGRSQ